MKKGLGNFTVLSILSLSIFAIIGFGFGLVELSTLAADNMENISVIEGVQETNCKFDCIVCKLKLYENKTSCSKIIGNNCIC